MKNKGYTMIEAVVAMFLVVVMVGAVFSALMSGRRAITSSTEKEEVFYSLQSAYGMLKDCRSNPHNCHLRELVCGTDSTCTLGISGNLHGVNDLFTFNFQNLCQGTNQNNNYFKYTIADRPNFEPMGMSFHNVSGGPTISELSNMQTVSIEAKCTEG